MGAVRCIKATSYNEGDIIAGSFAVKVCQSKGTCRMSPRLIIGQEGHILVGSFDVKLCQST